MRLNQCSSIHQSSIAEYAANSAIAICLFTAAVVAFPIATTPAATAAGKTAAKAVVIVDAGVAAAAVAAIGDDLGYARITLLSSATSFPDTTITRFPVVAFNEATKSGANGSRLAATSTMSKKSWGNPLVTSFALTNRPTGW